MKLFGRLMLLTLGLGLFAAVLSSLPSRPAAAAAGPPSLPVTVTNTPTVNAHITNTSLPVTGSVNAAVTGTVSVNNFPAFPATLTGPTVPVSGTLSATATLAPGASVSVSNTPTNAIPVVQAPAASALYFYSCTSLFSGGSASCSFPALPSANVTLNVESVSVNTISTTGSDPVIAALEYTAPSAILTYIPMQAQASFTPISTVIDSYTGVLHGPLSLPLAPTCSVLLSAAAGPGSTLTCTNIGYVVPAT